MAGYAVIGTLHVLVWNPMAAVPGATLEEIHVVLGRIDASLAAPVVIAWATIGMLLAAAVLTGALWRSASVKTIVTLDLLLLVLGGPTHLVASFPAGLAIADTFATTGWDHAPWGWALYVVSAMALVAVAVVARRKRGTTVPRASR